MGVGGITVRFARPDEAVEAARPLAVSHAHDPGMAAFFPDPRVRPQALRDVFGLTVADALAYGEVHVAVADRAIVGTAAWLPPGAFPPRGLRRLLSSLPYLARILRASPRTFRLFMAFSTTAARQLRGQRVWFLAGLGVDPGSQRSGIGGRLLHPVLDRADADGATCALNTQNEANVAYYRRFGFESMVDGWRAANGPAVWTLRRPPGGAR
jgi:GNAT superfamily N-acetyltransferase